MSVSPPASPADASYFSGRKKSNQKNRRRHWPSLRLGSLSARSGRRALNSAFGLKHTRPFFRPALRASAAFKGATQRQAMGLGFFATYGWLRRGAIGGLRERVFEPQSGELSDRHQSRAPKEPAVGRPAVGAMVFGYFLPKQKVTRPPGGTWTQQRSNYR